MKKEGVNKVKNFMKGSLFVQSCRIGFVLFLLLFFLFAFIPHNTYFSANIETNQINIDKCIIEKVDIDSSKVICESNSFGRIMIEKTFEINEVQYGHDAQLSFSFIELKPISNNRFIRIEPDNSDDSDISCRLLFRQRIINEDLPRTDYIKSMENNSHDMKLSIGDTLFIHNKTSFCIVIEGYEIKVRTPYGQTEFDGKTIMRLTNGAYLSEFDRFEFMNPIINDLEISSISECVLRGTGDIAVHYNPEPNCYSIQTQELNMYSSNSSVSVTIKSANDKYLLSCLGYANTLKLSGNSLIPSLFNLIKENVYLAPTLIVTMIGGAITLIKIYKESNESKRKTRLFPKR